MAGFYNLFRGVPGKLGVGVADEGVLRSSTLPIYSLYGPPYMVRRSIALTRQSYATMKQDVPTVSPLGLTGSFLHGVPLFQRLAKKG